MYTLVLSAPSILTETFQVTKQSAEAPAPKNSMLRRFAMSANLERPRDAWEANTAGIINSMP